MIKFDILRKKIRTLSNLFCSAGGRTKLINFTKGVIAGSAQIHSQWYISCKHFYKSTKGGRNHVARRMRSARLVASVLIDGVNFRYRDYTKFHKSEFKEAYQ